MGSREPKYLKGVLQSVDDFTKREIKRPVVYEDERFICQKCSGSGKLYYTKGGDPDVCDLCNGQGMIHLQFTIERLN
ncbi:hypothetical protein vBVpaMR16F_168 [Vibrio phage vB_VpaM_R16F]|nr:hypothetical protein vBVpaMR16F_168 [Vibrio phage vB_VpaM_R16F]